MAAHANALPFQFGPRPSWTPAPHALVCHAFGVAATLAQSPASMALLHRATFLKMALVPAAAVLSPPARRHHDGPPQEDVFPLGGFATDSSSVVAAPAAVSSPSRLRL